MDAIFPRPQVFIQFTFELALRQSHGVLDDRPIRLTLHRGKDASFMEWITALLLEDADLVGADLGHFTDLSTARESVVEVPSLRVDITRDAFLPLGGEDLSWREILAGHIPEDVELVFPRTEPADHEQAADQYHGDDDAPEEQTVWDAEGHTRPPLRAWLWVVPWYLA